MSADWAAIFCPVPLLNINAQCKKVVHINDGKTAPDLFSLQRYFLCDEHQASSSSSQTDNSGRLHTHNFWLLHCLRSSRRRRHRTANLRHRSIYGAKSGGEKEEGGASEGTGAFGSETSCYEGGRPPRLGPAARSGVQGETQPWWAQLHQRQNVTLQNGNNRLSILVTVSRIHSHSKDR